MTPTRDQARAAHAYDVVGEIDPEDRAALDKFKIVVNSFGATVLRGGLCAAVAWVQRYHDMDARDRLLRAIATAGIAGVGKIEPTELPKRLRELPVADYMLATRDALAATVWMRRAVQASRSS